MKSYKMLLILELKRNYKQIVNLLILVLLFAVIINSIIFLFENEKIKLDTTIGVVVEDDSTEVNLLLSSVQNEELKKIISFKKTDIETGKKLLSENKIVSLIYIEKDTYKDLDSGNTAKLNMYVNNQKDLRVLFLTNYIENMVDMLNSSQNSAIIYYNILKENGEPYEKRIHELNSLSMKYIKTFLFRDSVFKEDKIINKYLGLTSFDYYYNVLIILLIVIASIIYFNTLADDIKKGTISRLINCGYLIENILISKILISLLYISIVVIPLKIILMSVLSNYNINDLLIFIFHFIIITIFIQCFIIYFYLKIDNDITRDIIFISFFSLLTLCAGFIMPIDSLPKLFDTLKEINILYIPFKMLIGRTINIVNIASIIFYSIFISYLLRRESVS
ncbi:ABC transporter permease [Clostridiaceae bacterium HSG29]|nr:ABC transporter permease [Clostridiaceae bacterium HSG29]